MPWCCLRTAFPARGRRSRCSGPTPSTAPTPGSSTRIPPSGGASSRGWPTRCSSCARTAGRSA
eukprot:scaffold28_cov312-Pinguiococcus_pyrenoidosus.AAC.5